MTSNQPVKHVIQNCLHINEGVGIISYIDCMTLVLLIVNMQWILIHQSTEKTSKTGYTYASHDPLDMGSSFSTN